MRQADSAACRGFSLAPTKAVSYISSAKRIIYTGDAARDLTRYGNMAARIRKAMTDYAAGQTAQANKVTRLVGSAASRTRVGDYRIVFVETADAIVVTRIGPRASVYN